jgi:hypothetical protein
MLVRKGSYFVHSYLHFQNSEKSRLTADMFLGAASQTLGQGAVTPPQSPVVDLAETIRKPSNFRIFQS